MTFGLFFFENYVVVPMYAKKVQLQQKILEKEESKNNDRIIVLGEGGKVIYKADYYDDKNERLYAIYIVYRKDDKSMDKILRADSAFFRDEEWTFVNPNVYKFFENGTMEISKDTTGFSINEPPETFRNNVVNVDTVDAKAAKQYIAHLRRTGLPYAEAMSQYYKKFSFPFVVFIVVFLSIGLSGKTRKNVLLISLVLSLCAAVLFYVTQMVTMLLAKFGYIPALMGAWFPVFLFIALSVVVMRFART
jgi:lipopolysaccharide export system permease protein